MVHFLHGIPECERFSQLDRGFFREEMTDAGETPVAARQRAAHFRWLAQDPAAYQRFVNRAGGIPVESK